ncbi:VOC family protein [Streptomyces noursei]|uniref:VOC family protein n=1 Tax=Streptomyces noursei TaxID=1971 RepID=UPI0036428106
MPVTLNHTIVPAADHRAAARFLATVMGLAELPPAGRNGHFAPVRVNETLTLDFMAVPDAEGHHLAFDVDPATFDGILARLRAAARTARAGRRGRPHLLTKVMLFAS